MRLAYLMDRVTRWAGPLSSLGGEGRGEEALIPATLRKGSRNGPRKLHNTRRVGTMLKASSPQPSPPNEERERHASCVVSIKLNATAPRPFPLRKGSMTPCVQSAITT